jgi:hypothetical protein
MKRDKKNAATGKNIGMTITASNAANQSGHGSRERRGNLRAQNRITAIRPMPTEAPTTSADTVVGAPDARIPVPPPMAPAIGVINMHISITFILPPNGQRSHAGPVTPECKPDTRSALAAAAC